MARQKVVPTPLARDAVVVLGQQIRVGRHSRGWTASQLAARLGVSQATVLSIESGAPGTAIGTVFNAAALVGVPLFGVEDKAELARMRHRGEERLALMPKRVHYPETKDNDDDFRF